MANEWAGKILKGMDGLVDNISFKGEPILHSNKAINTIGKFMMGETNTGIRGTLRGLSHGQDLGTAVKSAYTHRTKDAKGVLQPRSINWGAVAGTYVGASVAGRVITGGGLYRDSTGNVNIPGIPFI